MYYFSQNSPKNNTGVSNSDSITFIESWSLLIKRNNDLFICLAFHFPKTLETYLELPLKNATLFHSSIPQYVIAAKTGKSGSSGSPGKR